MPNRLDELQALASPQFREGPMHDIGAILKQLQNEWNMAHLLGYGDDMNKGVIREFDNPIDVMDRTEIPPFLLDIYSAEGEEGET